MDSRLSANALAGLLGDWHATDPAYEALADAVRVLCLDNRIAARTALPAERELAARLGVSRTTVAAAYRSLRDSGHLESHRGSGSVTLPLGRVRLLPVRPDEGVIDLQQASPAAWPGLASVFAEAAASATSVVALPGYDIHGRRGLREAIAAHYTRRGLDTEPDQIIVTPGAQSAISFVASVLVGPGDRVVIETPTYPHAADAFRRRGARLIGVPVGVDDGWDLERSSHAFRRAVPAAAYLMPDFQNPTGRTMSSRERTAISEDAAAMGTMLIVDETTGELDIDRGSVPPFEASVSSGVRIITLGSLGKTVWGGLRIGWIRSDMDTVKRLIAGRPAHDLGTPDFEQLVAERAFARMPEILAQRAVQLGKGRDALVPRLRTTFPEWHVPEVHGGVSLWAGLGAALSSSLVLRARARGLLLSSGPRFAVDGGHERHLRIPFTAPPQELDRAVDILAATWNDVGGLSAGEPYEAVV
jgi:DNA-binding transcriptional MocR family regulator